MVVDDGVVVDEEVACAEELASTEEVASAEEVASTEEVAGGDTKVSISVCSLISYWWHFSLIVAFSPKSVE